MVELGWAAPPEWDSATSGIFHHVIEYRIASQEEAGKLLASGVEESDGEWSKASGESDDCDQGWFKISEHHIQVSWPATVNESGLTVVSAHISVK